MAASELSKGEEVGRSAFARMTAMIYWVIVLEIMFLVATSPGLIASFFVSADLSNFPLFVACLLPVGPALSGLVYSWRRRAIELDLSPAPRFWRGYRLNFVDVMKWWVPFLILVAMGGFVATHLSLTFLSESSVWLFVVLGVLAALWAAHMLILTSVFSFRTRDAARLAVYFFFRCFSTTLLYLSLLVVCFALTYLVGMWLPVLAGSIFSAMYVRAAHTEIYLATDQFTLHEEDSEDESDESGDDEE